eukprot:scaffold8294_cov16-Tisochrysis_lutea.AAC.1
MAAEDEGIFSTNFGRGGSRNISTKHCDLSKGGMRSPSLESFLNAAFTLIGLHAAKLHELFQAVDCIGKKTAVPCDRSSTCVCLIRQRLRHGRAFSNGNHLPRSVSHKNEDTAEQLAFKLDALKGKSCKLASILDTRHYRQLQFTKWRLEGAMLQGSNDALKKKSNVGRGDFPYMNEGKGSYRGVVGLFYYDCNNISGTKTRPFCAVVKEGSYLLRSMIRGAAVHSAVAQSLLRDAATAVTAAATAADSSPSDSMCLKLSDLSAYVLLVDELPHNLILPRCVTEAVLSQI